MIGGFFGMWFWMIVLYIIFVILNILDVSVWILNLILVFIYIKGNNIVINYSNVRIMNYISNEF